MFMLLRGNLNNFWYLYYFNVDGTHLWTVEFKFNEFLSGVKIITITAYKI